MTELGGWTSSRAVRRLRVQSDMVPGRDEVLALITDLATGIASPPRVLDLGCGDGDVSAAILARRPDAAVTLLDISEDMLAHAQERLRGAPGLEVVRHDLHDGLPDGVKGPFDAVVSCFTLHNLDPASRPRLFADVRRVLGPRGVFVNADRVREEGTLLDSWQFDHWVEWMRERARTRYGLTRTAAEIRQRQHEMDRELGDAPGSIWAMRDDLRRAGFAEVDCLYKNRITALLVAVNEG
jgi:tRNA (cmo5U34)-methyltransferase